MPPSNATRQLKMIPSIVRKPIADGPAMPEQPAATAARVRRPARAGSEVTVTTVDDRLPMMAPSWVEPKTTVVEAKTQVRRPTASAAIARHASPAARPPSAVQPTARLADPTKREPIAAATAGPVVAARIAPASQIAPEAHGLAVDPRDPPNRAAKQAGKLIVSAYRLLGFSILTIIVVVLIGYIATTAFFYLSSSWVVPTAVSASDVRVVAIAAQVTEQQNHRDLLADQVHEAERSIAMQRQFQADFTRAIQSDLEGRQQALSRLRALAGAGTRAAIASSNRAFAAASRQRLAQDYEAGLIDRSSLLSGKYQLAQISSSNLSLAERQAELETRAADLAQTARSLDALLANAGPTDTALSYEVLQIKQAYETSRLELAKAVETRDTLVANLARQDRLVDALAQTAFLRAVTDQATVAFVPYANLGPIEPGTPLYGCRLGMVICRHVGEVRAVLPGEVQFKHPHKDQELRGQLVEWTLDADEAEAGQDDVLFAGGKPLWF